MGQPNITGTLFLPYSAYFLSPDTYTPSYCPNFYLNPSPLFITTRSYFRFPLLDLKAYS